MFNLYHLLSASGRLRLEHHTVRKAEFKEIPTTELVRIATFYLQHSPDGRMGVPDEVGVPTYSGILVDVIIPEMIRRLEALSKPETLDEL